MLREFKLHTTACISIRIGDKVKYEDGRIGILKEIEIKPNGVWKPILIARLRVKMKDSEVIATADKFTPVDGEQYLDS